MNPRIILFSLIFRSILASNCIDTSEIRQRVVGLDKDSQICLDVNNIHNFQETPQYNIKHIYSDKSDIIICNPAARSNTRIDIPPIAIKTVEITRNRSKLEFEVETWIKIEQILGNKVPKYYGCAIDNDNFRFYIFQQMFDFSLQNSRSLIYLAKYMMRRDRLHVNDWISFCLWLFEEMARIVDKLHTNEIVHFDIKPANFMISLKPTVDVKIIDFEMAESFNDIKELNYKLTYSFKGSEYYRDIVLKNGEPIPGPHNDIYSLGNSFMDIMYSIEYTDSVNQQAAYTNSSNIKKNRSLNNKQRFVGYREYMIIDHKEIYGFHTNFDSLIYNMKREDYERRYTAKKVFKKIAKIRKIFGMQKFSVPALNQKIDSTFARQVRTLRHVFTVKDTSIERSKVDRFDTSFRKNKDKKPRDQPWYSGILQCLFRDGKRLLI